MELGKPYTYSVYMKAEKDDVPVLLRFGYTHAYAPAVPLQETVKVGKTWQRYVFTKMYPKDIKIDNINSIGLPQIILAVTLQDDNVKLWIDAAQCEEGTTATPYTEDSVTRDYWAGKFE